MGIPCSSLECEVRVIQANNIDPKSTPSLFVRFHLSHKRMTLNTHQTSSNSNTFSWDSSFSLHCSASHDSMQDLMQQTVVFELRSRKSTPFLWKLGGSQSHLLGTAEVAWRDVLEAPNMEIDKWVLMGCSSRHDKYGDPLLQIQMKVEGVAEAKMGRRRRYNKLKEKECCCGCKDGGCNCLDYDIFALTPAFEDL